MALGSSIQRIVRLTPLSVVLALIESRVAPANALECPVMSARGRILAADVAASRHPPWPIALRDGFAIDAGAIVDASSYAPVPLASVPRLIEVGAALPGGTDAVAPLDAVTLLADRAEAVAAVPSGDGVLSAGGDAVPERPLRRAGECLRATDVAIMAAAGISRVAVRTPRIRLVRGSASHSPIIDAALDILDRAIAAAGGATLDRAGDWRPFSETLTEADAEADAHADAVIAVGGSGSGQGDESVQILARQGRVDVHGIAISPGETAAFGFVSARPVLILPGRIDAALATWLLIGRPLVAKLAGGGAEDLPVMLPLKRKVTSTVGLAELIPVQCVSAMAEPLASGYLPFEALTRGHGWIVVPAGSEGHAAGTPVAIRPWT